MDDPAISSSQKPAEMKNKKLDEFARLIPKLPFKHGDREIDYHQTQGCSICLDLFAEGVMIRRLPQCKHIFHDACLLKRLDNSEQEPARCPHCNKEISLDGLAEI